MPELTIFKAVLRARDGGIYGLHVAQDFYFMRAPKLFISIMNPPRQDAEQEKKSRYAKMFLDPDSDGIHMIRKLRMGVSHLRSHTEWLDLCKIYKGGKDHKRRYGVDVVSRILTMYAEKNRIILKIEISKGEQKQARNKEGALVPGVVKPMGGAPLTSVSYALNEDAALDLAFALEKEYTAWRCALNMDFLQHPEKYAYTTPASSSFEHPSR